MSKTKIKDLDLDLYKEKLNNGLEMYVIPFKNINNIYATFTTKYGSVHNEFTPINKEDMIKVPDGIAHFLEHKLFEQKDGRDPSSFFSERGAECNASTTYYKTNYLFYGANNFEENLNYLLDYVQNPFFTDKSVEKEKGIIAQEIKMYEDDPFIQLREKSLYNVFSKHPIRIPILGTEKSINKITKDDLYTCYNTFYHPSNMLLVVTGNVDPDEVFKIAKKNQSSKEFLKYKKINIKKYKEPSKVFREYEEVIIGNVTIPKFSISYKLEFKDFEKIDKLSLITYLEMLFDIKLGITSNFYQKLREDKLLTETLQVSVDLTDEHLVISILGEAKDYKKVIEKVEKELTNLEIDKNDFERKKKVVVSSLVYASENIYSMNSKIANNIVYYGKVLTDSMDEIKNFSLKDMNYIISKLNLENKSICIVKGKSN